MKSIQANNSTIAHFNGPNLLKSKFLPSYPYVVCVNAKLPFTNANISSCHLRFAPLAKHKKYSYVSEFRHRGTTICKLGGEDKSAGDNEGTPWKALEKAIGNFRKEQSVEDVLRQQIQSKDYYDEGSGNNPPGGGDGNGGGGDGSGGSEDEGFSGILDETMQVILATLGFIFLYIYIITGEELTRLAKDYIKFLFGGRKSIRLTNAMYQWRRFVERLTEKNEIDNFWLEKAIITTPTWYDSPAKYKRLLGSRVESDEYDEDEDEDEDEDDEDEGDVQDDNDSDYNDDDADF